MAALNCFCLAKPPKSTSSAGRSLQLKGFMQVRHYNLGVVQEASQDLHGLYFAVYQKGACRVAGLCEPVEQLLLIGMGGKTTEGIDLGVDLDLFLQHPDLARTFNDLSCQRTCGCITDKDHRGFRPPQIMAEMVCLLYT